MKTFISISVLLSLLTLIPVASYSQSAMVGSARPHAVMRPDWETLAQWKENYRNAPEAVIDTDVGMMLSAAKQEAVATSMSLLSYLDYTPADRDQGYCGNCWVWSGTGILEIADSVNYGTDRKHRHSIQFLNSCMTQDDAGQSFYACKGGDITKFSNWYRGQGQSIPWSNTKAYWQDYTQACGMGTSSCVSCSSIATYPSYSVSVIQPETIATQGIGVGQDKAIANIKNVLQQNRAVEYGFCLATTADWNTFTAWWDNQPESSLLPNMDSYCGKTTDAGYACHAVLLVGYNDDDANAANHYWIMLNSWGTTAGRPNGLFRVPMVMNYDCTWQFDTPPVTQNIRYFSTLNTGSGSSNTLTVNKSGTGAVTSSDGRISCGSTCSATYTAGTIVTLTATALSGGSFTGWSGDCTGTNSTCSLTMDRGRTATATFSSSSSTTLTVAKMSTNNGGGTVTSAPSGINCGSTCKYGFSPGDTVTLTASPNASSGFTGWGRDGATCGTADACTVTVNSAMTVSAGFMSYTINASPRGTGTGTITSIPAGITCGNACKSGFPPGTPVTLNANPQPGSVFTGWNGACTGTDPSCAVTVSSNITVTATFDLVCSYSVTSPPSVDFVYNGGYKTLRLAATNTGGTGACPAPSVAPVEGWLSYDSLTFGNAKSNKNKGSVRIKALSHADTYLGRSGTVNIGPDPTAIPVNQAGKSCTLGPLSPASASLDSTAHPGEAFAAAPSPGDCGLTAVTDPACADCSWIANVSAAGNTVSYDVDANDTGKSRVGRIIVSLSSKPTVRKVFTVRQSNIP